MDTDIVIKRCFDYSTVLHILENPTIKECILEDGCETVVPDLLNEYWFVMHTTKGELIGGYRLHFSHKHVLQVHALIIPEFRREYSKSCGERLIQWIKAFEPGVTKLYCKVPSLYENIIKHVTHFGFVKEGHLKHCFLKNKTMHDVLYYSLNLYKEK